MKPIDEKLAANLADDKVPKYGTKVITDMHDLELIQVVQNLNSVEAAREKASKHQKFNEDSIVNGKMLKKMEFPPLSENYLNMKKALVAELEKRNIKLGE